MLRCIQLAKNGLGTTYPNPMVGSVIVHNDNIIGEGWHYKAGHPHAEVNAINSVAKKELLKDATIYVSLEPCSHFGKTPPCADLIIEHQIKNVVIGSTDPNQKVAGRGIEKLKAAGCDIRRPILEAECRELNKRFFTFHTKKRPYILLKWAETRDGFMAPLASKRNQRSPVWITNERSRQKVHKIRTEEQAILVGTQTVLDDDPSLTARDWHGESPLRIIIDKELKIPEHSAVFNSNAKTIVFTEKPKPSSQLQSFREIDFSQNVPRQIILDLYDLNIQSVLIEGGGRTLQSFIDIDLWDEAIVFKGDSEFKEGIKAAEFTGTLISEEKSGSDLIERYKNNNL